MPDREGRFYVWLMRDGAWDTVRTEVDNQPWAFHSTTEARLYAERQYMTDTSVQAWSVRPERETPGGSNDPVESGP